VARKTKGLARKYKKNAPASGKYIYFAGLKDLIKV
jgi:hypothetical protein